jgi:hypothetical protein
MCLPHQLLPGWRWAHLRVQLHRKSGEALLSIPVRHCLIPPIPSCQYPQSSLDLNTHSDVFTHPVSHANTPAFLAYLLSPHSNTFILITTHRHLHTITMTSPIPPALTSPTVPTQTPPHLAFLH